MEVTKLIIVAFFKMFSSEADIVTENVSLRQQLAIYKRKHKRIPIRNSDRLFWVLLSKIWTKWKLALIIVKPETALRWHRNLFKIYWRWKSRGKPGRIIEPKHKITDDAEIKCIERLGGLLKSYHRLVA